MPLELTIIQDYFNRLFQSPVVPFIEGDGHLGEALFECSQDQVLPGFSWLRSALSALTMSKFGIFGVA